MKLEYKLCPNLTTVPCKIGRRFLVSIFIRRCTFENPPSKEFSRHKVDITSNHACDLQFLIFSVHSSSSWEKLKSRIEKSNECTLLLIGDISVSHNEVNREVSQEEVKLFVENVGAFYVEISMQNSTHLKLLLLQFTLLSYLKKKRMEKIKSIKPKKDDSETDLLAYSPPPRK